MMIMMYTILSCCILDLNLFSELDITLKLRFKWTMQNREIVSVKYINKYLSRSSWNESEHICSVWRQPQKLIFENTEI